MAIIKYANNYSTVLAQNASAASVSLYVDTTDGLPVLSGGDFLKVTLMRQSDGQREIVRVTAVDTVSKILTVVRGEEGTTPISFVVGDEVELRLTAGSLDELTEGLFDVESAAPAILAAASAAALSETNAAASEAAAAASEAAAATSEGNALTSETNAATSESNAATSESNAAASEAQAEAWAQEDTDYASGTDNSAKSWAIGGTGNGDPAAGSAKKWATEAEDVLVDGSEYSALHYAAKANSSATDALNSAVAAAASYDSFDDRYLGAYATDPVLDNDGDPLTTGALYFNTVGSIMKNHDGTKWRPIGGGERQVETVALSSGQTVAVFTNDTQFGSFYIAGDDVDQSRLVESVDYNVDHGTFTVTLTDSYPDGSTLLMIYGTVAGSVLDITGTTGSIKFLGAEPTEVFPVANALAFDYTADGEWQYVTLTQASTVLSVVASNLPAGHMLRMELYGADSFAPDVSAFTPVLNGDTIVFDVVTIIFAEKLGDGTVRYIAGGTYAS